MGLSSPGIGSGLDVKGMVDAMVKADIAQIQARQDKKLIQANTELSGVGQLKSALSTFEATTANLSKISSFYKLKQSMSETGYFSATVTDKANPGVYQIKVQSLAQSQSVSSNYFANSSTTVGSGYITINFGTYSADLSSFTVNPDTTPINITIAPGNDTLTDICNTINATSSTVSACIVQDSLGARLSITSLETGANYAMQITSDIAALNYDPTTNNTTLTENMAAQNSIIQVNGMTINQSTNVLTDVVSGISLNLKQADATKTINLTVENNQEQLTNAVNDFVKKYNDCMSFLNNVTSYNKETEQPGFFQGDYQVKNLKTNLHDVIANYISVNAGSTLTLADIGIKTTKTGLLELDQTTFNDAVRNHYNEIGGLFAKTVSVTDPNIQVNSTETKVAAGAYDITLSQYTPGVSMTGTIGEVLAISSDGIELNGTGKFSSLSVNVLGGAIGNRGQVVIEDGLAVLMDEVLNTYLGKNGELEHRTDFLNAEIKDLGKRQVKIDERSQVLEKKYLKQWNAVDLLISRLQDTSSMLTQALSTLPKLKVNDN